MRDGFSLVARLDRLGVEKLARSEGLPPTLAVRVAEVVTGTGLPEDKRAEVFQELVSHFQDGLATGKTPDELVATFGDTRVAATAIRQAKRVITPESLGGSGSGDSWIRQVLRDGRYAIRRLKARPAFTAIAVLSLGLGIGANTAMFTLVNDVILRQPALDRPEELVDLYTNSKEFPFNIFANPDYDDLVKTNTAFAGISASKFSFTPYQVEGVVQRLTVELVSGNYFQVLGLKPKLGRLLVPGDAPAPGQGAVVLVSERFWRRALAADPAVIGKPLTLAGGAYTVIGVVPQEYGGRARGIGTDLYVPMMMINQLEHSPTDQLQDRSSQGTFLKGRLKPGVSLAQATVEVKRVAADLRARKIGQWEWGADIVLIPSSDIIIFPPLDRMLKPLGGMLLLVVGLILVVACANLAGFLLARAVDRRKEIAVRLALGATRGQLIAQLLVETVMLALAGGGLGFWLGRTAIRLVLASNLPVPLPVALDLAVDWRILGFSLGISVLAGVLFGLLPALQSTRLDLASVIRDEATGGGRKKWTARNLLVGGQVAVSMVLMIVAGLFMRSLSVARRLDPGFGRQPATLAWMGVPADHGVPETRALVNRLRRRLAAVPGVRRVGLGSNVHLNTLGSQGGSVRVDGIDPPDGQEYWQVDRVEVDTGYIAALGLLIAGRQFAEQDADSVTRVAIVNQAFVDKFWPGKDAVGRRYRGRDGEVAVVGVVNTAKIRSLAEDPRPTVYLPMWSVDGSIWAVVQTEGDERQVAAAVGRAAVEEPGVFINQARSLREHIEVGSLPLTMGATALLAASGLALLLACIGLYGAVSYGVSQRSREVGIRLSLGADRVSVIRLLLWGGMRVVLVGAVVGLGLAVAVGKLLEGMLFGVAVLDPVTLLLVPVSLLAVATLAAYLPARRAGQIAPITALRAE